jgi:enoyl-CoA hydratase/carnithine racemase
MNANIDYGVDAEGIATVTLDRPDRLNAFTLAMGRELIEIMDAVDADDTVRAVVITGRGRGFCAGADLSEGTAIFDRDDTESFDMGRHADYGGLVARRFFASTKPLIAAINGPAVGIGITMTLPTDVRLIADDARVGFVFARRGLVPEACSSFFLPRLVGISTAMEWVCTGRLIPADEAVRSGLVRSKHAPDELLPAAYALAREMTASTSAVAVAVSRQMLWQMWADGTPELAHLLDSLGTFHLGRAADCIEGVASFLEKRPPQFRMRVSEELPDYVRRCQAVSDARSLGENTR